jgi:hypothetical protein
MRPAINLRGSGGRKINHPTPTTIPTQNRTTGRLETMYDDYDDLMESDPDYATTPPDWRSDPHRSSQYVLARKQYKEQCRMVRNPDGSYGLPCAICHRKINYNLTHPNRMAFTLDHRIPIAQRPDLALAVSNFQPAHAKCNRDKSTGRLPPMTTTRSISASHPSRGRP